MSGTAALKPPGKSSAARLWVLLGLAVTCYFAAFAFYPDLFWFAGVNHYGVWFLDSFAVLASNDAITRGINPYGPNPLDYFHRPHVYSNWWLHLRDLGLTRADNVWLGLTLVGLFLLAALSRLKPAQPRQLLFYLAVLASSPVLLAVNRANIDLVIFVLLTPLVSCLLDKRPVVRYAAPFLIAVAAGLKYFPAAAGLVLVAAAPARELRWRVTLALGLLVLVGVSVESDLAAFGQFAPQPEGFLSFGAMALTHALGWDGAWPKLLGLALGAGVFVWFWRSRRFEGWAIPPERQADWLHFILGAVLLAGCFFTSLNFAYRWIFAVWMAPLLWWLPSDLAAPGPVRSLARLTRTLLIAVLWIDTAFCFALNRAIPWVSGPQLQRWADRAFILEQPLFWAFFVCVLAFLACFSRRAVKALFAR